ncbi:MAG: SRPBCC family protein [Streptosporangiaceae bacterium]
MSGSQRPEAGQRDGHALSVERVIDASPETIFDAFIALYDSQRPDWVTGSQLDLRLGGRWSVCLQVPDGPAFREERVITALERPGRLAYDMTAEYAGAPGFATTVEITIEAVPGGQRLRLAQRGFPGPAIRDEFAGAWPDVLAELDRRVFSSRPR